MFNFLVLDIETRPTDRDDVKEYITANIKPPATYKLPESIAKWHKEHGPAEAAEVIDRTGLDGAFGRVCCVGMAIGLNGDPEAIYGTDEAVILQELNCKLDTIPRNEWLTTTVVGHNVSAFDLRFLMQRYIANGIRPHSIIKRSAEAKPWEQEKVFDTMVQFAGTGNRISLEKLCLSLNIKSPKGEMNGSMVGQYFADGRLDEIATYCKSDISATQAVARKMTFQ